jgi:hypothetical protein
MIDVFYPYFEREAKWNELIYSVRSLEKHFKEEFRVFIVGDLPKNITGVTHIPHKRSEGMKENCTFDAITKLLLYLNHPDAGLHFIRMYDDICLINDVSGKEIARIKAISFHNEIPAHVRGTWSEQLKRTIAAVRAKGYPGINTESHFPEAFIGPYMKEIIQDYSALENRLLTSTLYYNTWCLPESFHFFKKDYGIQFYGGTDGEFKSSNEGDLEQKCKGKLYLNYNNAGLNDNLKKFLMKRFPKKSRFEI